MRRRPDAGDGYARGGGESGGVSRERSCGSALRRTAPDAGRGAPGGRTEARRSSTAARPAPPSGRCTCRAWRRHRWRRRRPRGGRHDASGTPCRRPRASGTGWRRRSVAAALGGVDGRPVRGQQSLGTRAESDATWTTSQMDTQSRRLRLMEGMPPGSAYPSGRALALEQLD